MTGAGRKLALGTAGIFLFVGLPLLGWGIGDVGGFLASPVRLGFLVAVTILNAFAAAFAPPSGDRKGDERKRVRRQQIAVTVLQVTSLGLVSVGPYCDRRGIAALADGEALRAAGLALYVIGFLVMHWTQATLGRHFSVEVTIQKDHALVTAGPYRLVRHPRYLGVILFSLGLALVFATWVGLVLAAAVMAVLLWRIPDEEAMMRREFGSTWDEYARRTRRILPRLY